MKSEVKRKGTAILPKIKDYIVNVVLADEEGGELRNRAERVEHLKKRIHSEHDWEIKHNGLRAAIIDWLQGCSLSMPIYNNNIVVLFQHFGCLPEKPTQGQIDRCIDAYYGLFATAIIQIIQENRGIR
jgi:hypothetical protein